MIENGEAREIGMGAVLLRKKKFNKVVVKLYNYLLIDD